MAILDGKHVENSVIDPAKHRFIGTWRPPAPPQDETQVVEYNRRIGYGHNWDNHCPCGAGFYWRTMDYQGHMRQCWLKGMWDEARYESIKEE